MQPDQQSTPDTPADLPPQATSPEATSPETPAVEVASATFPDVGHEHLGRDGSAPPPNLGVLHDVELDVTVEFGRRQLPLADVLRLGAGSVIELEKMVGEPLAIYANGRLIAEGEAVVVDEQFGVRITRLATSNPSGNAFH